MKTNQLLRIGLSMVLAVVALTAGAQTSDSFKGAWYSPELYLYIDFYARDVPDPNSMDGDPCPGVIKMKRGYGESVYSFSSAVVAGNKAVAHAYIGEGEAVIRFTDMGDGTLKMDCSKFTYVTYEDGVKTLPMPVTLRKASPFLGTWQLKGGDGRMQLNLYHDDLFDGDGRLCYGTISVSLNKGMYVDDCAVTRCEVSGDKAVVYFTGSRSSADYRAVLLYDPSTDQVTVSEVAPAKQGQAGECYVTAGMIFAR